MVSLRSTWVARGGETSRVLSHETDHCDARVDDDGRICISTVIASKGGGRTVVQIIMRPEGMEDLANEVATALPGPALRIFASAVATASENVQQHLVDASKRFEQQDESLSRLRRAIGDRQFGPLLGDQDSRDEWQFLDDLLGSINMARRSM